MHLLRRKSNGKFGLTDFRGKTTPPYAILSHRWFPDGEEPTFKDLMEGTGETKTGYTKLRFCGEQAAKDGLDYFWADTCCFDKSSSAVLTESINSMFRYYHEATKCYVYLRDVSINQRRPEWEAAIRSSEWFTRGWTLQELIAPASVEFFSSEGKRLGDKRSMEQQVSEITGIPVQALRGDPLSSFSTTERMSWATKRTTLLDEDLAYCLMGIFDVHMPLIYGEGKKALNRLSEEIDKASKAGDNPLQKVLPGQGKYNCFGQVTGSRTVRCEVCKWEGNMKYLDRPRMTKRPSNFTMGQKPPYEVLFQRFHHKAPNMSFGWYRCFICRDGKMLEGREVRTHVENNHTWEQVCD